MESPSPSAHEVTELITALYSSKNTSEISSIQDQLQSLQKSSHGFAVGVALLETPDQQCQYFGALTITVFCINQPEYTKLHAPEMLTIIVDKIFSINMSSVVTKKLLSGFGIIYGMMELPVDPAFILCQVPRGGLLVIDELSLAQWSILFYFYTIIGEDYKRETSALSPLHHRVQVDVWPSLLRLFATVPSEAASLALDTVVSWVGYISAADSHLKQRYTPEEAIPLVQYLLSCFTGETPPELLIKAFSGLTEMYEICPSLLSTATRAHVTQLLFAPNQFGQGFVDTILSSDSFDEDYPGAIDSFITLVTAYLNYNIVYLTRHLDDGQVQQILATVLKLSNFNGKHPVEEEQASEQLLVFWDEFANTFDNDSNFIISAYQDNLEGKRQYIELRDNLLMECTMVYWRKAAMVEGEAVSDEFSHYRNSVGDLFVSLNNLISMPFYRTLTDAVIKAVLGSDIGELEVSLFLWYKVMDELAFYADETAAHTPLVDEVFQVNLMGKVSEVISTHPGNSGRQLEITLLRLLSSIKFFFNSDTGGAYLGPVLTFLFSIVFTDSLPSLISSKTTLDICQESPERMVPFLPELEPVVAQMIEDPRVDNLIRQRMCNALVSISQGLKQPGRIASIVHGLLTKIVAVAANLINNPTSVAVDDAAKLEDYAVSLVSCINEAAKASRLPDDHDGWLTPEQQQQANEYWHHDPLKIKPLVLECVQQFGINLPVLATNGIVTEKCCHIFKYGLGEAVNGPFVFDMATIVDFLSAKIPNSPPTTVVPMYQLLETIVITSGQSLTSEAINSMLQTFFIQRIPDINQEIDLVKPVVLLFSTLVERKPSLLISLPVFREQVLSFCVRAFGYNESFTIKAVTQFWSKYISLKRGNQDDHQVLQDSVVGGDDFRGIGFDLTRALLVSYFNALRSGLDHYYPVFRALVAKFPMHFKRWLEEALISISPNTRCSKDESMQFVSQLMVTRGRFQAAQDVLRRWWLAANGLSDYK